MASRSLGMNAGRVLLASAMAFALVEVLRAPRWTVDDAFITARYADHLAHAGVFAYNLEGPHVEGITSPLFALVGAAASALGLGAVAAMTALGVLAFVASGAFVYALARELRVPAPAAGIAVWVYLAIPEHVTHATSGLETEAFIAIELACAWMLARWWRSPNERASGWLLGACLLACLLRPEGHAVAAVMVVLAAVRVRRRAPELLRLGRSAVLRLVAPLLVCIAARAAYFHALLPNTFFAKRRGAASAEHLRDTAALVGDYLLDFVVVGGAVLVIARVLGTRRGRIGPRATMLAFAAVSVLCTFAPAYAHKDVMNYSRRFAMHGLPWLVTLTLLLTSYVASRVMRLRRRRGRVLCGVVLAAGAAFVGLLWLPGWALRRDVEHERMSDHVVIRRDWYEPARALISAHAATLGHPARLAVYPDAGYVPYRTDFFTLDFGRLNDRYLAREARTSSDVVDYFFASAVDAVIFSHYGADRLWNEDAKKVMHDPRFESFVLAGQWRDARAHGISVYLRRQ